MKSEFIPKIGKYYSLKENAVFTRIKLGAWTFIVLCTMMIIGSLSSEDSISVAVSPTFHFHQFDSSISTYGENSIKLSGKLEIKHPSLIQRLLMPRNFIEFDILNCLLIITIAILLLWLLPHIHSSTIFQTDISSRIRWIGIALISFCLLDYARIFFYIMPEISRLTNDQFLYIKNGFILMPISFWLGITVLWIGKVYKNAFHLKQEQQLTI